MKPHHAEARRLNPLTRACRIAGVEPGLGLAADLLPLNRGVMLMIGRTAAGRVFWVERAGLALDARTDPPEVMTAEAFRAGLELIGRPVAIDRHGIKALWAEEEPRAAWAALMELLE
jgi:hypothetical protein